jgi:pyruvate-formate lyase-activating enzyme
MGKPVWVRYVLVPGLTDDPANVAASPPSSRR